MFSRALFSKPSLATRFALIGALLTLAAAVTPAQAQSKVYGYYEVVGADALNIRRRPYQNSEVLTVARRGETLVKWRFFCSLRPWCPVQLGDVKGWAGKKYLAEVYPD